MRQRSPFLIGSLSEAPSQRHMHFLSLSLPPLLSPSDAHSLHFYTSEGDIIGTFAHKGHSIAVCFSKCVLVSVFSLFSKVFSLLVRSIWYQMMQLPPKLNLTECRPTPRTLRDMDMDELNRLSCF